MNGEKNDWLVKATNAQYSIKHSVAKVNGYGTSEDIIKSITDNAFDDFVKFVRKGFTPILNELKSANKLFTAYDHVYRLSLHHQIFCIIVSKCLFKYITPAHFSIWENYDFYSIVNFH